MRYALLVYNDIEVGDRINPVAGETQELRAAGSRGAIEIRPVRDDEPVGA